MLPNTRKTVNYKINRPFLTQWSKFKCLNLGNTSYLVYILSFLKKNCFWTSAAFQKVKWNYLRVLSYLSNLIIFIYVFYVPNKKLFLIAYGNYLEISNLTCGTKRTYYKKFFMHHHNTKTKKFVYCLVSLIPRIWSFKFTPKILFSKS